MLLLFTLYYTYVIYVVISGVWCNFNVVKFNCYALVGSVLPYPDGVISVEIILLLLVGALEVGRLFWGTQLSDTLKI